MAEQAQQQQESLEENAVRTETTTINAKQDTNTEKRTACTKQSFTSVRKISSRVIKETGKVCFTQNEQSEVGKRNGQKETNAGHSIACDQGIPSTVNSAEAGQSLKDNFAVNKPEDKNDKNTEDGVWYEGKQVKHVKARYRCGKRCSGINCKRYAADSPGLSFFRFPKDEERSRKWVINCRNNRLSDKSAQKLNNNHALCAHHFEDSQFTNAYKDRLNWNAIPTLFDCPNPPPRITPKRPLPNRKPLVLQGTTTSTGWESKSAGTLQLSGVKLTSQPSTKPGTVSLPIDSISNLSDITLGLSASNESKGTAAKAPVDPRIRSLRIKVKNLTAKVSRMKRTEMRKVEKRRNSKEECIKALSYHMSGPTLEFMKTQIKLSGRPRCGVRFQRDDIAIAYSFYNASPKCYRLLSKLFILPTIKTMKRAVKDLDDGVLVSDECKELLSENAQSTGNVSSESGEDDEHMSDDINLHEEYVGAEVEIKNEEVDQLFECMDSTKSNEQTGNVIADSSTP